MERVVGLILKKRTSGLAVALSDKGHKRSFLRRSLNKTCCLGEGNRRGTSIETEGQLSSWKW
jgi:hypothetical protein